MITIQLKAMGVVDRFFPQADGVVTLEEGDTVQQLLDQFSVPKRYAAFVAINEVRASLDTPLTDGDSVLLSSIVGGA